MPIERMYIVFGIIGTVCSLLYVAVVNLPLQSKTHLCHRNVNIPHLKCNTKILLFIGNIISTNLYLYKYFASFVVLNLFIQMLNTKKKNAKYSFKHVYSNQNKNYIFANVFGIWLFLHSEQRALFHIQQLYLKCFIFLKTSTQEYIPQLKNIYMPDLHNKHAGLVLYHCVGAKRILVTYIVETPIYSLMQGFQR